MSAKKKIKINGIVQGVGFRPFVHRMANKYCFTGWVNNNSEGVFVEVQGDMSNYPAFIDDIKNNTPKLAKITSIEELKPLDLNINYDSFSIKESESNFDTETIIPLDSCICDDCLKELFDKNNRRYHYPFINCTNCGPRYSIIKEMPYDRPMTTMKNFKMCKTCQGEYDDISDRRYHAQPNACEDCGPKLWITDNMGNKINTSEPIKTTIDFLKKGKILAIKSLTGFHLAVDATNHEAVNKLRKLKKRDNKPFAIMVENTEKANKYAHVSENEKAKMNSYQRPILILKKKNDILRSVAPNNPNIGIMLPSAPLHYLLLSIGKFDSLVMTSANISGQPILYKNDDVIDLLDNVIDYVLMHNRDIHNRLDDSIIKLCETVDGDLIEIPIRMSRGYAPYTIKTKGKYQNLIALGAELKTTVALSKKSSIHISPYIGDLKNDEVMEFHTKSRKNLTEMFNAKPDFYIGDMHPNFRSTTKIKELQNNLKKVQHHHAHFASCMIDNNSDNINSIGIIYDGTGYGEDHTIWGGEIFVGNYEKANRVASIKQFKLIGNDKAVKEPHRVAFSLLYETYKEELFDLNIDILNSFSEQEKNVYFKMADKSINTSLTSSMGRLFDGISALLGICSKIEYEAQAAIELEGKLQRNIQQIEPFKYKIIENSNGLLLFDFRTMVKDIVEHLIEKKYDTEYLARKFHSTIVNYTKEVCEIISNKYDVKNVFLSGGVFMNEYLLCNLYSNLKNISLIPHTHKNITPNDSGIAVGQLMVINTLFNSKDNNE